MMQKLFVSDKVSMLSSKLVINMRSTDLIQTNPNPTMPVQTNPNPTIFALISVKHY